RGQRDPGQAGRWRAEGVLDPVHDVGGEGVLDREPLPARRANGGEEVRIVVEGGDEQVAVHQWPSPLACAAAAAIPLISHMAMTGRTRTKSRKQVKKRPKLPIRMA